MPEKPDSERIEAALATAKKPLSIDEICERVWGTAGERQRNAVRVNLHRLDQRGVLVKHPQTYELKR